MGANKSIMGQEENACCYNQNNRWARKLGGWNNETEYVSDRNYSGSVVSKVAGKVEVTGTTLTKSSTLWCSD